MSSMKIRTCQKKNLKITDLSKRMEAVLLIVSTPPSPPYVSLWNFGQMVGGDEGGGQTQNAHFMEFWGNLGNSNIMTDFHKKEHLILWIIYWKR